MIFIIPTYVIIMNNPLMASPEPWYIDPTRPRALEAALALLGVQVEYFTRFTADEVNTLVVRTGLRHIRSNIPGYVPSSVGRLTGYMIPYLHIYCLLPLPPDFFQSGNVRRRSGIRDADKTPASINREKKCRTCFGRTGHKSRGGRTPASDVSIRP